MLNNNLHSPVQCRLLMCFARCLLRRTAFFLLSSLLGNNSAHTQSASRPISVRAEQLWGSKDSDGRFHTNYILTFCTNHLQKYTIRFLITNSPESRYNQLSHHSGFVNVSPSKSDFTKTYTWDGVRPRLAIDLTIEEPNFPNSTSPTKSSSLGRTDNVREPSDPNRRGTAPSAGRFSDTYNGAARMTGEVQWSGISKTFVVVSADLSQVEEAVQDCWIMFYNSHGTEVGQPTMLQFTRSTTNYASYNIKGVISVPGGARSYRLIAKSKGGAILASKAGRLP